MKYFSCKMYLSKNIKYLRRRKGWTTQELAEAVGLKQPSISAYEQGTREPNLKTLLEICEIFQVSAHKLLTTDLSEAEEEPGLGQIETVHETLDHPKKDDLWEYLDYLARKVGSLEDEIELLKHR